MIKLTFKNWELCAYRAEPPAYQFDDGTVAVVVDGDIPSGWTWELLIAYGDNLDIAALVPSDDGLVVALSAQQLAYTGYYTLQLRATQGGFIKHTSQIMQYIGPTISGDAHWPEIPTAFSQAISRAEAAIADAQDVQTAVEQSAGEAAQSATDASAFATAAAESAASAAQSATAAETARTAAENAQEAAEASADTATGSAATASQKATEAAASATAASASATATAESATDADMSATAAAGSAASAAESATAAETAQTAAENAQLRADLEFVAIMADVEIPEHEDGGADNESEG